MKKFLSSIRIKFKEHPELWFFVFANIVFVVMYIWSLLITPALLDVGNFILFTTLTLIHIGIHWSFLIIGEDDRWFWPYVIVQGLLAFVIIQLSQNIGMLFGLYMALIGEVIGTGRRRTWSVFAIIYFVILSLISQLILEGTGTTLWWLLGMTFSMIFVVMYVSLYTKENTARIQAQELLEELNAANRQLANYADRVEDLTLTNERQRMARELHDTLAQGLAGLILQLEAADSHISTNDSQRAQSIIQQAMLRARTTLSDARRAISDLRDSPSTRADLTEALQVEADHFSHTTGIPCSLELCKPDKLPPEVTSNVIRFVSEGLTNVAKHAQATQVTITMSCPEQDLCIEISDNGIGFNPDEAIGKSGHFGLIGMRERTRISGGTLTIESTPNQGTNLRVLLPMSGKV
jgi:NarL family two-component system sensor histidine kinase YdfH